MNPERERKLKELGIIREELQELEMNDDLAKLDALLEKYRAKGYGQKTPETREKLLQEACQNLQDLPHTPFEIQYHHRYDLRSWLRENFPFVEKRQYTEEEKAYLSARSQEILSACLQVRDINLQANSAYIAYYQEDWKKIEKACKEKDFEELGRHLDDLLGGIDWE